MKKLLLFSFFACLFVFTSQAQNDGAIKIKVIDSLLGEGVPYASVTATLDGKLESGTTTDMYGNGLLKPLKPGTYIVRVLITGYETAVTEKVVVKNHKLTSITVKLKAEGGQINRIHTKARPFEHIDLED
jgi:hypothetical protein